MPSRLRRWADDPLPRSWRRGRSWLIAVCALIGGAGCDASRPSTAYPQTSAGPAHDLVDRPPDELVEGKVLLGSPSLTAGITGNGPLRLAEIDTWLADPRQHEPLDFVLPLGLREGADEVQIPADNPLTRAKIELGRQLFVDRRMSPAERNLACFRCHIPLDSFTDHVVVGDPEIGLPRRAAPMTINRIFGTAQFWDGRAPSLEAQAIMPISTAHELANTHAACVSFLQANPGYRRQFEVIFGGVSIENVGKAIASFLRAIVTGPSRYDYWKEWQGWKDKDEKQLSDSERRAYREAERGARLWPLGSAARRGHDLFMGKARCSDCHTGPNFSDEQFHNLGVGFDLPEPDLGRFLVTGVEADRGAFRTPTLRNVARSPGYMHGSQFGSLADVVAYLSDGGHANEQLDPAIRRLDLSAAEQADLAAFMVSLTSELPAVSLGRLPE